MCAFRLKQTGLGDADAQGQATLDGDIVRDDAGGDA